MNREVDDNGKHGNVANVQTQSVQLVKRFAKLPRPLN